MNTVEQKKIGVSTATIIGMNAMIGAGVFTAPAAMASNVGPAGIVAYLFVVIAVWFLAQSLARLAYLYPQEGSFYTYAKQWGGHYIGLLSSGLYLVGLIIAMGLLAKVAGFYLHDFIPFISSQTLGLIVLWVLVALNMFGVTMSELGQQILIICTVLPLLLTTIICFAHADIANLTPFMPHGIGNIFKATRIVIFGFFGFESAASLFTIVDRPEKNVPRALTYSIILVGIIYTLFIASIIISTPASVFTGPDVKVPQIIAALLPGYTWLVNLIYISILSAVIGTIHSMIWGSSALCLSLANKMKSPVVHKLLDRGILNNRFMVFMVGVCITLSNLVLHNIDLFFNLTALCIISAFILSLITLLPLRSEWKSGRNINTVIGIITAVLIFYFAAEGLYDELFKH